MRPKTAGVFPIDVRDMHIDIAASQGTGLLGPQGTRRNVREKDCPVRPVKGREGKRRIMTYNKTIGTDAYDRFGAGTS